MNHSPTLTDAQQRSWDTLQNADVYVTKIGGVNAADFRGNLSVVSERQRAGKTQVLAISAPRSVSPEHNALCHPQGIDRDKMTNEQKPGFNTTSHLIALAKCLQRGDRQTAMHILGHVRTFLHTIVDAQCEDDDERTQLLADLDASFAAFAARIGNTTTGSISHLGEDWLLRDQDGSLSITGFGEAIAQTLYERYFAIHGLSPAGLRTEHMMDGVLGQDPRRILRDDRKMDHAIDDVRRRVQCELEGLLRSGNLIVSRGHLPLLGTQRGYGDMTGALLAQAAHRTHRNVAFIVEKEHPISSADPKKVQGTGVIPEMTPALGMEAFGQIRGADGGAIHPQALAMLARDGIDTFVLNPAHPTPDAVTHIHAFDPAPGGIEMVAARPVPVTLRISTPQMYGRPGFMESVSRWFARKNISIDSVRDSEVTLTVTVGNGGLTDERIADFRSFLEAKYGAETLDLTVMRDRAAVFCLGNNIDGVGPLNEATSALRDAGIAVDTVAQSTREAIVFVVAKEHAATAREVLHQRCVHVGSNA